MCYFDYHSESDSNSLSTGAIVTITVSLTFILTLTVTAVVTFIMTYFIIKKKSEREINLKSQSPQEKVLYEPIELPRQTITKDDLELQPNPAYGTSHPVIMDANPAYESYS